MYWCRQQTLTSAAAVLTFMASWISSVDINEMGYSRLDHVIKWLWVYNGDRVQSRQRRPYRTSPDLCDFCLSKYGTVAKFIDKVKRPWFKIVTSWHASWTTTRVSISLLFCLDCFGDQPLMSGSGVKFVYPNAVPCICGPLCLFGTWGKFWIPRDVLVGKGSS